MVSENSMYLHGLEDATTSMLSPSGQLECLAVACAVECIQHARLSSRAHDRYMKGGTDTAYRQGALGEGPTEPFCVRDTEGVTESRNIIKESRCSRYRLPLYIRWRSMVTFDSLLF